MSLFTSNKTKTSFSTSGTYIDGLSNLPKGVQCGIYAENDVLLMQQMYAKGSTSYNLQFSQITNIGLVAEQEIVEKGRSVVGRGMIGGLVFGSIGAIVGGLSGVPNKETKETTYYLAVNYKATDSGEISSITFKVSPIFTRELVSYVQKKIAEGQPQSINL